MEFNITCLRVKETPRNGKYVIVYNFKAWRAESLRMRGWLNAEKIYTRPATPQEKQEAADQTRELAFRYHTWEELVEDEARYGIDANALRKKMLKKNLCPKTDRFSP
jgi:hypothetical protein